MKSSLVHVEGRYRIVRRADDPHLLQIVATVDGKRYRIGAGTDIRQAKLKLRDFIAEMESGYKPNQRGGDISWRDVSDAMTRRQRNAARARGIPFEIGERLVFDHMVATSFRCAVSGIAFSKTKTPGDIDPWAPSIDRIDNRHGYVVDNIRVVCAAANIAMNRWGLDMLIRLSHGVVRTSQTVPLTERNADTWCTASVAESPKVEKDVVNNYEVH